MKLLKPFSLLFFVFSFPSESLSQMYPGGPVDPRDQVDQILDTANLQTPGVSKTTYYKLCEIRRFFCGYTKLVMIAIAVFSMGVLTLAGKLSWSRALIVATGMVIFVGAESLAITLTTYPPNLGVVYSCFCFDNATFGINEGISNIIGGN